MIADEVEKIEDEIKSRLRKGLNPVAIMLENNSQQHAGHRSSPGTGASHFSIMIRAVAFENKSRIECHRMVTKILADLMNNPIHALSIDAKPPESPELPEDKDQ